MIEVKPKGDGFVHNVFPQRNKSICTIQVYNNKIIQINYTLAGEWCINVDSP